MKNKAHATFIILLLLFPLLFTNLSTKVIRAVQISPEFDSGTQTGILNENNPLDEASGLAASRQNPNVLWTHEDDWNHFIFAMNRDGTILGKYRIGTGGYDVEDIAIGPGPAEGADYLYVGHIGDNDAVRSTIYIRRVPEPMVGSTPWDGSTITTLSSVDTITLQYPDGAKDAETLMFDTNGDMYIVSKRLTSNKVYRAAYPQSTTSTITLELVATLPADSELYWITAGDISDNGEWIILRNDRTTDYASIWYRSSGSNLWDAFDEDHILLDIQNEPQGEAICYDPDSLGFYTVSEHAGHATIPIWYYTRTNPPVENTAPVQTSFSPVNQSIDNDILPQLAITVTDPDGDTMNLSWYSNSSGTWKVFGTNTSVPNGTYTQMNNNFSTPTTTYWCTVSVHDGINWTNATYSFTTRAQYISDPPSSFTATVHGRFQIDLTWSDDNEADSTLIEWSNTPSPWNRGQKTELYNGSAETISQPGLNPGTTRYYQAWSWNNTDNTWSNSYGTTSATTNTNNAPVQSSMNPSNESTSISIATSSLSVTIQDPDGDSFNWTIETSPSIGSNFANDENNGSKTCTITGLQYSTTYTWYINATDDMDWARRYYVFTTEADPTPNNPIVVSSPYPTNNTIDVPIAISTLGVLIQDPDGDSFDWSIESSPDVGSNSGTSSNGSKFCSISGLSYSKVYTWFVNVSDGEDWTRNYYQFTTEEAPNTPPFLSIPSPVNGSTDVSISTTALSVSIQDPNGDNFDWTIQTSPDIGDNSESDTSNGSKSCSIAGLEYSTTYTWFVNVTDGEDWTRESYIFTTEASPVVNSVPVMSNPSPANNSLSVSVSTSTVSITIEDPDGDSFDWTIKTSPDIGSETGSDESNGSKSCSIAGLEYSTTYTWFVNVTDGEDWTREYYIFTTEAAPENNSLPSCSSPLPVNGSTDISISTLLLSIIISDADEDLFNWSIETTPAIGNASANNASNGSKTVNISGLSYATTYIWYVNVTDDGTNWTRIIYLFTTENEPIENPPSSSSNPSTTDPTENKPPKAEIKCPCIGYVNQSIFFNASNSTDSDGDTLQYRWDFNNDSIWEVNWTTKPITTYIYELPGNFTILLEVKDKEGKSDSDTFIITISYLPENESIIESQTSKEINKTIQLDQSRLFYENNTIIFIIPKNTTVVSVEVNNITILFEINNNTLYMSIPQNVDTINNYLCITFEYPDGNTTQYTATISNPSFSGSTLSKEIDQSPASILTAIMTLVLSFIVLLILFRHYKQEKI